ncbi:hypothetical protein P389DRAFT_103928 [Cystobasidium minutum MCA 4210]|uniref:uncharacterized protein n=1 Tax=Cystobasidium minutum MCA 4210 TaxID=1397322 RepID=UPI0034CF936A|eukprot:jgi/Rhomi1/103928/CE103927_454
MPSRKDAGPNSGFFSLKRRKSPESSDVSNDARRRITIACLRCRHRKIRCDGSEPCNKCNSAGADCQYYAVTKEENQAAREKKALAKATRNKAAKQAGVQVPPTTEKEDKKASPKKRTSKIRRNASSSESSATPEPMQHQQYDSRLELESESHKRPRLHIEPAYTLPEVKGFQGLPSMQEQPMEHDDTQSTSDSADTYFGYLSSSTASLQSSIYEPVYAQEPTQYIPNQQDYHISPITLGLEPSNYPNFTYLPAEPKLHEAAPTLSYPMESRQPSGLCLYLDETQLSSTFTPYASASNPVTPSLPQLSHFPQPSPPSYHGPIDWSSRPLAPYQNIVHPQPQHHHQHHQQQAHFYQRPRSYSDLPVYTQTVSLDQVCSAGV